MFKGGVGVDFLTYTGNQVHVGNPVFRYRRAPENWRAPFEASFGFGDPNIKSDNEQFGAYIQDDWSVTKLVLNLGVRWDIETNMINNDYVTPQPLADSLRPALRATESRSAGAQADGDLLQTSEGERDRPARRTRALLQ